MIRFCPNRARRFRLTFRKSFAGGAGETELR
jgi:hypothetical protein